MSTHPEPVILLIGYGNELRGDDAIGPRVARSVGEGGVTGLQILTPQQLTPELAEPISEARAVVFVDATLNAPPGAIQIGPLAGAPPREPLGHLGNPRALLALAQAVFDRAPPAWMITVGIENLSPTDGLSPAVEQALPELVNTVRALIERLGRKS